MTYLTENVGHVIEKGKIADGLKQIYVDLGYAADLNSFAADSASWLGHGAWARFDQGDFVGIDSSYGHAWDWDNTTWNDYGWIYLPHNCYNVQCRVHVSFHSCYDNAENYAGYSGLREFAANNNVMIIFPESDCWNMRGTHPADGYWLTKSGLFPKAVQAIICRATSEENNNVCPKGASNLLPIALSLAAVTLMSVF